MTSDEDLADARASAQDDALFDLLAYLQAQDYDFVTPNNRTYRILAARDGGGRAQTLRDVLGWSRPFAWGEIDPTAQALLVRAEALTFTPAGLRSRFRVARVRGRLFLHSAYGADPDGAVFLGPDTYRFAAFLSATLCAGTRCTVASVLDVGAGAGVGGIVAADLLDGPKVTLSDVNTQALRLARINARHAGVEVNALQRDGLTDETARHDLILANPPFIAESGRPYSDGGALGLDVPLRWAREAMTRLNPGGRLVLYSGAPVMEGHDALRVALARAARAARCDLNYEELDPDIFSEELRRPVYAGVERIAAVGAVITQRAS
jgi:methylase of polypeptide subunit release factors